MRCKYVYAHSLFKEIISTESGCTSRQHHIWCYTTKFSSTSSSCRFDPTNILCHQVVNVFVPSPTEFRDGCGEAQMNFKCGQLGNQN